MPAAAAVLSCRTQPQIPDASIDFELSTHTHCTNATPAYPCYMPADLFPNEYILLMLSACVYVCIVWSERLTQSVVSK